MRRHPGMSVKGLLTQGVVNEKHATTCSLGDQRNIKLGKLYSVFLFHQSLFASDQFII